MTQSRRHRGETGRLYKGLTEHAAPGVHEFVADTAMRFLEKTDAILEVGAGHGALSRRLRDAGFVDITTTDLNPPENTEIGNLDILIPPPSDQLRAYAGVFAIEIIEHVDNPGIAISNLASLLVPGGILILSTPNVTHPYSRLRYLLRGSPFLFGLPEYWSTGHVFPIPSWLLCELCAASDLTVTNVYRAGSFELGRFKRLIIKLISAVMYGIGTEQRPDRGDGVVAILVARN